MAETTEYRPTRRKTRVSAILAVEDVILQVMVVDISRDGAKLTLPGWVAPGSAVHLTVAAHTTPALIHWVRDGVAGVRFLDRLNGASLSAIEAADDPLKDYR